MFTIRKEAANQVIRVWEREIEVHCTLSRKTGVISHHHLMTRIASRCQSAISQTLTKTFLKNQQARGSSIVNNWQAQENTCRGCPQVSLCLREKSFHGKLYIPGNERWVLYMIIPTLKVNSKNYTRKGNQS